MLYGRTAGGCSSAPTNRRKLWPPAWVQETAVPAEHPFHQADQRFYPSPPLLQLRKRGLALQRFARLAERVGLGQTMTRMSPRSVCMMLNFQLTIPADARSAIRWPIVRGAYTRRRVAASKNPGGAFRLFGIDHSGSMTKETTASHTFLINCSTAGQLLRLVRLVLRARREQKLMTRAGEQAIRNSTNLRCNGRLARP